jgi:sugar phosphate isomerase/epimerase
MNPANDDTTKAASKRVHDPLVMPFSNVRHLDFRDKIRAAKLAGFGQLSLHPHETRDTIKGGLRPEDMREIAAENDVAVTRLDPLSNWNPRWLPTNMGASYINDFDIGAAEFFELCEENCFDRGWPGTGEFPLIEIVRTLADMDALRQVSPEVFSSHNATRSAAEIAALSSESLQALLDAANVAC